MNQRKYVENINKNRPILHLNLKHDTKYRLKTKSLIIEIRRQLINAMLVRSILKNQTLSEKEIEKDICERLSFYKDGYVCCVELSGRPIKTNRGFQLIPFKSKFYRRGMSDILFFYKGKVFAFEVKSEKEYNWVKKNIIRIKDLPIESLDKKKDIHIKEQYEFIRLIIKSGGNGGFVYCWDQVNNIIKNTLAK